MTETLLVPLAQFAGRLKTKPTPGYLDGQTSNVAVSSLADALFMIGVATLERSGCQIRLEHQFPDDYEMPAS